MYTIKQAAVRTGVSVEVLRAWERRYGIVAPTRTPAGYRLYDEAAIARIRWMRRLVDDGWSPSAAAAALRAGGPPLPERDDTVDELESLRASGAPGAAELVGRFVDAAATLDQRALESLLDDMFARGSFEHVAAEFVLPALRAIGDAWAAGRIDVAAEHLASHATLRRLAAAFEAGARSVSTSRSPILVGLPPGARHELGALAFATAARRAGLPVLYLGADLPAQDWLEAAGRTGARAAVIGVVAPVDVDAARRVGTILRTAYPELIVAFGGDAAPSEIDGDRTIRLPSDLTGAVDRLAEVLDRRDGG